MKIASWNVNGIRACTKSGLVPWLQLSAYDVILLQEVRADGTQIPSEVECVPGYRKFWLPAKSKKGYSGVGILSRKEPQRIIEGMSIHAFDNEGRVLTAEFDEIIAVSAYFPNSQDGGKRLDFKLSFCEAIHEWLLELKKSGKIVVLGGDYNIAPSPIDLARPDENEKSPGYLPEERAWMKSFLESGWIDSFRYIHPELVKYSWWSARTRARERNVGWRIDFHVLHEQDRERIVSADIENEVLGSDHCPINLEIEI